MQMPAIRATVRVLKTRARQVKVQGAPSLKNLVVWTKLKSLKSIGRSEGGEWTISKRSAVSAKQTTRRWE